MDAIGAFRAALADLLRHAADGHRTPAERTAGADLKVVALLERLAAEAATLDADVIRACRTLTADRLAAPVLPQRDALIEAVGVIVCPPDAAAFVQWLDREMDTSEQAGPAGDDPPAPRARSPGGRLAGPHRVVARDVAAGFAIVGPILALRELRLGFDQSHARTALAAQPAVPAVVVTTDAAGTGRGAGWARTIVIDYPRAEGVCRSAITADGPSPAVAPGQSLMVVPLGKGCGPPLVPSLVGDPAQSFMLAVVFMAAGLGTLALWLRMNRRAHRHTPPAWRPGAALG